MGKTKSTKKAALKKTAKKARKSTKKAAKKAKTKPALVCATGQQCFWAHNGAVLSNLSDLYGELERMSDEEYLYHASGGKNDFADWVESVLQDKTCANGLRKARRKSTAESCVKRRLSYYSA